VLSIQLKALFKGATERRQHCGSLGISWSWMYPARISLIGDPLYPLSN
jgi:hypothetical protein